MALYLLGSLSLPPRPSLTAESRPTVGGDVQQRLGQDSLLLETLDEDVPLSFGQLGAVLVHEKREMSEGGRLPAQRAVHQEVFGRRNEPLGPSQDVADLHVMVIHNVGQVIGGKSVRFHHDGVTFHLKRVRSDKKLLLSPCHASTCMKIKMSLFLSQMTTVDSAFRFYWLTQSLPPSLRKAYLQFKVSDLTE